MTSTDPFDRFMDALERMIDAQDDMWEEEKYSNYRQRDDIKESRYTPAKEDARVAFKEAVREEISRLS